MPLRLVVSSAPSATPPARSIQVLAAGELTVGRHQNNDWVLPSLHVSRHHCVFREDRGQYWVHVTSTTNNVFIDDEQTVEHGQTVALRHGQRLSIGDFRLDVEIAGGDNEVAADARRLLEPNGPGEVKVPPLADAGVSNVGPAGVLSVPGQGQSNALPGGPGSAAKASGSKNVDLDADHVGHDYIELPPLTPPPSAAPSGDAPSPRTRPEPAPPTGVTPPAALPDNLLDLLQGGGGKEMTPPVTEPPLGITERPK